MVKERRLDENTKEIPNSMFKNGLFSSQGES